MSLRDFGADESADEMLAVNPDYQNLVELLGAARKHYGIVFGPEQLIITSVLASNCETRPVSADIRTMERDPPT